MNHWTWFGNLQLRSWESLNSADHFADTMQPTMDIRGLTNTKDNSTPSHDLQSQKWGVLLLTSNKEKYLKVDYSNTTINRLV